MRATKPKPVSKTSLRSGAVRPLPVDSPPPDATEADDILFDVSHEPLILAAKNHLPADPGK